MTEQQPPQEESPWKLAQVFVFDRMPDLLDDRDEQAPAIVARMNANLSADHELLMPLQLTDVIEQEGQWHAGITFDQHRFRLIGQGTRAKDESLDRAIQCSHWPEADKARLQAHAAHFVCYYLGEHEDPGERIIATHRLAAALVGDGLTGVIDPEAWTCLPAKVLTDITQAQRLNTFRNAAPAGLWTGFVKLLVNEQDIWFCTKGMHRWGRPDFAMLGVNADSQKMSETFFALVNYAIVSPDPFKPGDHADFGPGLNLSFEAVTEFEDYLNSPCGTVVVARLEDSESH